MSRILKRNIQNHLGYVVAGVSVGVAFLYPDTFVSILFGWISVLVLSWQVTNRASNLIWGMFFFGFSLALVGYYWLPYTITNFGGFAPVIASLLFSLFAAVSALQMVFVGALYRRLRSTLLDEWCLALPLSWLVSICIFPQLFPWRFCHTQLAWGPFAILAQYLGVQTLDVLLLLWAGCLVRLMQSVREGVVLYPGKLVCSGLTALLLVGGVLAKEQSLIASAKAPRVKVGLIQGNLETSRKGKITYLDANLKVYRRLTSEAVKQGAQLIFWPESVLSNWLPENVRSLSGERFDPLPTHEAPILFGALTLRERSKERLNEVRRAVGDEEFEANHFFHKHDKFNSVLGADIHGQVVGKFHKQALMPFGEYLPFSSYFPWIKKLSPQSGDFSFGDIEGPIRFPASRMNPEVAIQPLVCYEDLIQSVAFTGARNRAELLVNLTNDAWYGKSAAPYQHHAIAAWRAIETQRYLVRVTNTGYTAIVNTAGQTVADLPWFSEGVIIHTVPLRHDSTLAMFLDERHNYALIAVAIGFLFAPRRSMYAEAPSAMKIATVYD